ncbi:MAG: HEPN domain-containing protein [Candidatus Omnitrophica bacterium]|nr:HEPN domain-containing protein [Candidatus Omnitrophota bacterium]
MAKGDFLKERAEDFLKDAKYDISAKRRNLAAFHLEQFCLFYLKYYLFKKLTDFPKTHSRKELLIDFGNAFSIKGEISKFIKQKERVIFDLEQAYISSRYLPVEFSETQVKEMEKFCQKLIKFLKKYE